MASITRKKRATAEERRTAVEESVLAAMEQLLESGRSFTELSVEELARAAGISRSYFYMNFRDKSALVKALMTRVGVELMASTGVWFQQPEIATRRDLKSAMVRMIGTYEKHQAVLRAVAETSLYDEEIAALYGQMMTSIAEQSRQVAARMKKAGRAAEGLGADVAEALTWVAERLCGVYIGGSRRMSKQRLAEALTHIIWNAFVAPEPEPEKPARRAGKAAANDRD